MLTTFVPGDGVLATADGRVVFLSTCARDTVSAVASLMEGSPRGVDFVRACVAVWFRLGEQVDLLVAHSDGERTVVVAGGRSAAQVRTTADATVVDPTGAAVLAEAVLHGALVELLFDRHQHAADDSGFRVGCGLVPAQSFRLRCDGPGARDLGALSSTCAVPTSAPPAEARPAPTPVLRLADPPPLQALPVPTPSTVASVAPVAPATPAPAATGAPTASPTPPAATTAPTPSAMAAPTPAARIATAPTVSGPLAGAPRDALLALDGDDGAEHATTVWPVGGVRPIEQSSDAGPSAIDTTPSPERALAAQSPMAPTATPAPIAATTSMNDAATLMWRAQAGPLGVDPRSDDGAVDEAELTVFPESIAEFRRSMVRIAGAAPHDDAADGARVLGAYCTQGHFTDSRRPQCIFCGAEVDFDRLTTAVRPVIGTLRFDDGRSVELGIAVVIGRRPTLRVGERAQLVAIGDDLMLSRVHTEVRVVDWDVVVVDRQSANGTTITYPDGRRISARPNIENQIAPGTAVGFGNHSLVFELHH